ncbi:MAG: polysaccharide deacetylase family protein [Candidatus Limnocylindrales bacterium]
MQFRSLIRQRGRRYSALAAALGIAVVLVAAGWTTLHSGGLIPTPMPSTPGASLATVHSPNPTTSPTQAPVVTLAPATATPEPSFPPVNSCNPASVPGAIPVAAPASGKAGSFALHVPILEYHRIVPLAEAGNSRRSLVVPPQKFTAQLGALQKAGWHTITMATLANDLQVHTKPPARTFVITIDDGWDDGYTYALPILAQHGFVATYFVITGRIDHPSFLTSADLQALVAAGDEIGDHTMDHVYLTRQRGAKLTYEIDAAAARIAQVTGYWPESLAYPYGSENSRVVAAVAACQGLRIAVIEGKHPVIYQTWANRFVITRIHVSSGTTPAKLVAELGG